MVFCLGWLWKLFRGSNFDSNSFFSDAFFRFRHLSAQSGTRSHMQTKNIIGELKLETPKTKNIFLFFGCIQSAHIFCWACVVWNKKKIIGRLKLNSSKTKYFSQLLCCVQSAFTSLLDAFFSRSFLFYSLDVATVRWKRTLISKVAPSIFLMSKMKNNFDFRFSALFFLNHFV